MSEDDQAGERRAPAGFAGKRGVVWALLASWVVPVMMTIAYFVLIETSDVKLSGALWELLGLVFVFGMWWLFRTLTAQGAISRAVAVGDADRVLELADQRRGTPQHLYRGLGFEIRGDWSSALAELDRARPEGTWRIIAATVRVGALVETKRVAEARAVYDAELARAGSGARDFSARVLARLAEARLRWAEGDVAAAEALFAGLVDDIRAGEGLRAIAHGYAARIAAANGDRDAAERHRARARELAPRSWIAKEG